MSDKTTVAVAATEEHKGPRGRVAGPGAIKCDETRYLEFAKIWNETKETDDKIEQEVKQKDGSYKTEHVGGMTVCILLNLRKAGIANDETDTAQVRAFATKVKDYFAKTKNPTELRQFAQRLDRKKIVINWMQSKSPSEAFQKCIDQGVFGEIEGENAEEQAQWRKEKLQSHRAVIVQLRTAGVAIKKMGRTRTGKIDSVKFAEIWNSCDSISEVKDALIKAKLCSEDTKLSGIRAKASTLRNGVHDIDDDKKELDTWKVRPVPMKKLRANEGLDELKKLAAMLAEGSDISELADKEEEEEEEEEGEEEEESEEDDEDAEPSEEDVFGNFTGK